MGAAGRKFATEKFPVARMIEGNVRVYERVAAEVAERQGEGAGIGMAYKLQR